MADNPMTALQKIQQSLAQKAQPTPATGILGQTQQIEELSRAASGKALTGGVGPSRSRQAEKQVASQVMQGQRALQEQIQAEAIGQAQQTKAFEEKAAFENKLLSQEKLDMQDKFIVKQQEILSSFIRSGREFDLKKDKARAEQLGFMMRLNTDYYLTDLEDEASRAMLHDQMSFDEELARTMFNEELDLFNDNLDFRAMIAADEREFADELANWDIAMALQLAETQAKEASQQQMWQGIGSLMQVGASWGGQKLAASSSEGGGVEPTTQNASPGTYSGSGGGTQPLASQSLFK
jgi:hypothetical protein